MTQTIDHAALLPAYLAAGTAVLALLVDLAVARRVVTVAATAAGVAAVAVAAWWIGTGPVRETFCLAEPAGACSWRADPGSALVAVVFALLTLGVLGLSGYALRSLPAGEYCFLLAASMTGGVVLGYSRDLITLVVALETLTLPLYALVGLRRRSVDSAQGAVTFFVVSVVSVAVTLLGVALLYAATGALHLAGVADRLAAGVPAELATLATVGAVLVLAGLLFKVAAVPFHAWAPAAYDGAPVPVAAYLSTASKLGGVVAVLYVVVLGLRPVLDVVGPALAGFAVLTMTVGNLVALRQRRMVRLLAWSSVAQAGYILVPLGAFAVGSGRADAALPVAVSATVAYTVFYVMIELAAFGSVVALRGGADGGTLDAYRGAARRSRLVGAAFTLALVGLAGLPPGLAGLFAKVVVIRSLLGGGAGWLAVIVAVNAVIGLAYYLPVAARLYAPLPAPAAGAPVPAPAAGPGPAAVAAPSLAAVTQPATAPAAAGPLRGGGARVTAAALAVATLVAIVAGFAPQLILDAAALVAG
jgi:NADH-quinone oxidoreductase subunit N